MEVGEENWKKLNQGGRSLHGKKHSSARLDVALGGLGRGPPTTEKNLLNGHSLEVTRSRSSMSKRVGNVSRRELEIGTGSLEESTEAISGQAKQRSRGSSGRKETPEQRLHPRVQNLNPLVRACLRGAKA
jgi:hypothetical protein